MTYASYTFTKEVNVEIEQSIEIEDREGKEIEVLEYNIDEEDITITIDGCIKTDDDENKIEVFDEAGEKVSLIENEDFDPEHDEPFKVTLEGFVISKEELNEYKRLKQASNDLRVLLYISEEDKKDICQRAHTTDINDKSIWLTPDTKDTLGSDLVPWTESKLIRCTLQKDDHKTILRSMASQIVDKFFPEKEEEDSNEISRINDAIGEGLDAAGESKHPVHNMGVIKMSEDSKHKIIDSNGKVTTED